MSDNKTKLADMFETVLRVLYAHPAVEGVVFWGYWGPIHGYGEQAALVSGTDFTVRNLLSILFCNLQIYQRGVVKVFFFFMV